MTDYEYILQQVKLFHYKGWESGELRKCVDMLETLTRQELVLLYNSRWINGEKILEQPTALSKLKSWLNVLMKDVTE